MFVQICICIRFNSENRFEIRAENVHIWKKIVREIRVSIENDQI